MKRLTLFTLFLFTVNATAFAEENTQWRAPDINHLAVMTLPTGKVVFELTPEYAPNHVKHFKSLVKKGRYNGNKFYRVIDGFVAQTGPEQETGPFASKEKTLAMESEWTMNDGWSFTPVQTNDLFAEQTGFKNGFAVGISTKENKAWLTHCPGVLAMARGNEPDSASSHFYITNGQAPRYLDRIMTIFGRVVFGMEHVQAIQRTAVVEGQKAIDEHLFTAISDFKLMADLPKQEQVQLQIEDTESAAFKERLIKRRNRPNAFFYKKPPPVLDVCQVPVRTRLVVSKQH